MQRERGKVVDGGSAIKMRKLVVLDISNKMNMLGKVQIFYLPLEIDLERSFACDAEQHIRDAGRDSLHRFDKLSKSHTLHQAAHGEKQRPIRGKVQQRARLLSSFGQGEARHVRGARDDSYAMCSNA